MCLGEANLFKSFQVTPDLSLHGLQARERHVNEVAALCQRVYGTVELL